MNNVFCTVVSRLRAYQAIALFLSLREVCPQTIIYALCVDDSVGALLERLALPNVRLLGIEELREPAVSRLRQSRTLAEYCWTLKPVMIEAAFQAAQAERVTYLDSDLFFWNDPLPLFARQAEEDVLLSKGDISVSSLAPWLVDYLQGLMGNYNSGLISFRNTSAGLACLRWWKDSCLRACFHHPQEGDFGDQTYLNEMPQRFSGVADIATPGVNLGHWNYAGHRYSFFYGKLYVDNSKLICYHFSGFRILPGGVILQIHERERTDLPFFYPIYSGILREVMALAERILPGFDGYADEEDLETL